MNITWFPGLDPLPQHTRAQQAGGMGSVVAGSLAATDKIDLLGLKLREMREIARFSFVGASLVHLSVLGHNSVD